MTTLRPRRELVTPLADEACCCGSSRLYAQCCAPNLPTIAKIGKAAWAARKRDDKAACLTALRADLSLWVILHRTNTRPAMQRGAVGIGPLVEADIENLTDSVERVAELMQMTGEGATVPAMIESLREVVDDPRWKRRIVYLQAMFLWQGDDLSGASRELAKLGPILPVERDLRILRMALSLQRGSFGFAQALALYERYLQLADDLNDKVRALGMKAAAYVEHGDPSQAKVELARAAGLAPEDDDRGLSWEETLAVSWCLVHLGLLGGDAEAFKRAERLLRAPFAWPGMDPHGEGVLWGELANLYRHAGDPARAAEAYREALKREATFPASIFLAESLLRLGRAPEADVVLRGLDPLHMGPNEYEDYLFATAAAAVQTGDRAGLKIAEQRLAAHAGSAPYFEQRRLAFLLTVKDAIHYGKSPGLTERVKRLLADPLRTLNRWIMFEPNFFGIGIRGNSVINDFIGRKPPTPSK